MNNYDVVKRLIKIKEPLTFKCLEKYYKDKIKIKEILMQLKELEKLIDEYEKINWSIINGKEINYQLLENELDKLKSLYLGNKVKEIKDYDFSSLIFDFQTYWNKYSNLPVTEQKEEFYTKIAKYKAYIESNKNSIEEEFLSIFQYFKDVNYIANKKQKKYQEKEIIKYNELIDLILLKKNNLLNCSEKINKLRDYLSTTNFQKYVSESGIESQINWIKKPIDSLKEDWELGEIKKYFIYLGTNKFKKKETFYNDITNNKTLLKEELGLVFLKIFSDELKTNKNYLDFFELITEEIFKKCRLWLNDDIEINIKSLDALLKDKMFFLVNYNLSDTKKRKKELEDIMLKIEKKKKKENINLKINQNEDNNLARVNDNLHLLKQNQNQKTNQLQKILIETQDINGIIIELQKINQYFSLVENFIIDENINLENNKEININDIASNIEFNNKILEKMTKVHDLVTSVFTLCEEDRFLENSEFSKEINLCFKILDEKNFNKYKEKNDYLIKIKNQNQNKNVDNSISPSNTNLCLNEITKELQMFEEIDLIEIQLADLKKRLNEKKVEKFQQPKLSENKTDLTKPQLSTRKEDTSIFIFEPNIEDNYLIELPKIVVNQEEKTELQIKLNQVNEKALKLKKQF